MKITDISWDTDDISIDDLPETVYLDEDVDPNDIADTLSDIYGWCVKSFKVNEMPEVCFESINCEGNVRSWKFDKVDSLVNEWMSGGDIPSNDDPVFSVVIRGKKALFPKTKKRFDFNDLMFCLTLLSFAWA